MSHWITKNLIIAQCTWSCFWIFMAIWWYTWIRQEQEIRYLPFPRSVFGMNPEYTHVIIETSAKILAVIIFISLNKKKCFAFTYGFLFIFVASIIDLTALYKGRSVISGYFAWLIIQPPLQIDDIIMFCYVNGVIMARWACFLSGVQDKTHGKEWEWGIDQGDGVFRHPSALYESVFLCFLAVISIFVSRKLKSGVYFIINMNSYLIFRLFADTIRPGYEDILTNLFYLFIVVNANIIYKIMRI
jgi:prolipoprotein diacylglyceryltransferase